MAELYSQDPIPQQPITPAAAPDYTAKRSKFLASFAALDPEAKLDDAKLGEILTDEVKRDEFAKYVGQINPKFRMSGQELVDALGIKKKAQSAAGGEISGATSANGSVGTNGLPGDKPFEQVASEPAPLPGLTPAQPYNALSEGTAALGLPADSTEQVIPAPFVGPRPAGAYQKRADAGTVAEGTEYFSPASQAGQLNPDVAPVDSNANDGFFKTFGKQLTNLPATLENAAGNVVDYAGDLGEFITRPIGLNTGTDIPLSEMKATDKAGADLRADAQTRTTEVSARAKQSVLDDPTNGAAWGNLVGQGANSVVAIGAASLAGGPVAGVSAGAGLGISSTKDAARDAGLGDEEAMLTATVLAPVQGALEEMGVGFITKNKAVTGLLTKTIVGRALAEGGGKLSQTALAKSVSAILPGVVKSAAKHGTGEAVTEFLQGEAEGIAQLAADKLRGNTSAPVGQGRYGTTAFDALVKSPLEQAIGGFAVGTPVSTAFHGESAPNVPANEQVVQRRRAPEGTAPIAADRPASKLLGKAVVVRDDAGLTQLGKIHNVVGAGEGRAIIVKDAAGKLSRHPQSTVYTTSPTTPAPTPALPATPRTDPGPTADPAPTNSNAPVQGDLESASAAGNKAAMSPTLGELVPESATEVAPLDLTMSGQPVRAFRNAEGDVELHHADGQISLLDKGQQFDHPAADFLLNATPSPDNSNRRKITLIKNAKPIAIKPGDEVTVGNESLPVEDVLRGKAGQIEAVMVEGKNGSRIIEANTPDGKAALAELNAREAQAATSVESTDLKNLNSATAIQAKPLANSAESYSVKITDLKSAKHVPAYGTPHANREAGAFIKDGHTYTRQKPLGSRAVQGKAATATFADGVNVTVRYALMEADELQPSHTGGSQNFNHFLPEAQPKNRSAAFDQASQKAIGDIAANPDVAQLGQAPTAYAGAPIVNARGEVIQGNGRSEGIRQHYRQDGKNYRKGIVAEAQRVGIAPKQAATMKNPVLVRIADVSDVKARELGNYTAADTESGGARRLDPKQAANRLDAEGRADLGRLLAPNDDATLTETIRSRQPEILRFLQQHKLANTTQLQTLFRPDGTLTPNGVEDITALHRHLLFAEGDPNLPELFQELPVAAQNGLDRAAGYLAGLSDEKSLTVEIQAAIVGVNEYRNSGASFSLWTRQPNLFAQDGQRTPAERYSPLELALIKLFAEEKRPTFIAKAFAQYAQAANGQNASLFESQPAKSRAEAIHQTFQVADDSSRNPATTPTTPRANAADGRPVPPTASRVVAAAENPQRVAQPGAANSQQPRRNQATEQLADSPAAKRQAAIDAIKQRRAQQSTPTSVSEDFTQSYEIRPGEPETIRETGHQALAAAEKAGRRGKGRLLPTDGDDSGELRPVRRDATAATLNRAAAEIIQSDISADLRDKGSAVFVGRFINSVRDLATLAQVMRDPRWETFKYYFVKTLPDGSEEIVGESTMSARMPGSAPGFPDAKQRGGLSPSDWLKQQMAGHGADGYYCQHNHPSGNTSPSPADLEFTKYIMSQVPGFRAHIIINHKKYGVLTAKAGNAQGEIEVEPSKLLPGAWDKEAWAFVEDPLLQPSLPGPWLGVAISGTSSIAALSKHLEQRKDLVYLIGRGADGGVKAIGRMPLATLVNFGYGGGQGRGRGEAAIRKFARETGSPHIILAGLPKPKGRFKAYMDTPKDRAYIAPNEASIRTLIQKGVLFEAIDVAGKTFRGEMESDPFMKPKQGWIGPDPVPRVWEDIAAYGIGEEDLADYRTILNSYVEEGVVSRKEMNARFRADVGTDLETGLSDDALKSLVKEAQQNAGIVPVQKPGKRALKSRKHAERYDQATRQSFTEDEAKYAPARIIENRADADAYIRSKGLENAYAVAVAPNRPTKISAPEHIEIAEAVAVQYRKLSDDSTKAGNKELAAEFWQKSKDARAAKVSKLTDAGKTLAQVAGFVADDPDSVLDLAIKETEKQRKPKIKAAEKAGARVSDLATKARQSAMKEALNAPAVQKVKEAVTGAKPEKPIVEPTGYGASNRFFTKAKAAEARVALRKLGLSTIVPPELVNFVGYHIEALARAGGDKSFAEVSRRVVASVGARFKPLLPAAYQAAREQFVAKGGTNKGFTEPADVAALVAPAVVKGGMKSLGTTLDKIAREVAAGIGPKGKTLAERFVAEAGLSPKDAATYAAAIEAEFTKQVHARKAKLRNKILTFSTRVLLGRQAATAVDKLLNTLNLAVDPASAADLLKAQLNLPDITPAQADHFVKLSERVRNAKSPNERSDRVQDLMKALGQVEKLDWREVAQSTWYASVLSGPLTHVTNITANAKQLLAEGLISTLSTWADTGSLAAATGPARGAAKAQRRAIAEATRIITTGYTGTQSEKFGHNNVLENNTFAGGNANPINGLKFVGRALVGEDAYFNMTLRGLRSQEVALKNAFKEVSRDAAMAGEKLRGKALYERAWATAMGTLYGIPDLVAASESQADAEALTGTARQNRINELVNQAVQAKQDEWARIAESEGLSGVDRQQRIGELQMLGQPAELVADAAKFAEIYTYNNTLEGRLGAMGDLLAKLGELPVGGVKVFKFIVPFTKILTNVQNRALEWSGIGFIRAIKGGTGSQTYQGGKFYREYTAEEREKAFLRSTLGVVSALALWSLAKSGQLIITGNYPGDKDKDEERPANSIKWGNGLFTSYRGDTMEIILASIGNLLAWEAKEEKAGRKPDVGKRFAVLVGMTSIYTLEMGPTRSVEDFNKNVLGAIQNPERAGTYLAKFGVNTAKGLVPYSAAVQQVMRTANILNDASAKETASDSAWEAAYNSLVQDVPVVRDELGNSVDILGDPLKLDSNRLWGWMPQGRDPQDQKNLDWLSAHDLIPTRSRVTDDNLAIYVNGKLRPMNATEFHQFQVLRGQTFKQLLREAMTKPSELPGLPAAARAAILAAGPEANLSLAQMDIPTAKKVVARLRKAAIAAGKQAVLDSHQPKAASK